MSGSVTTLASFVIRHLANPTRGRGITGSFMKAGGTRDEVVCGVDGCTVSFSSRYGATSHRKTVHERLKDWICCDCGETFLHRNQWANHREALNQWDPRSDNLSGRGLKRARFEGDAFLESVIEGSRIALPAVAVGRHAARQPSGSPSTPEPAESTPTPESAQVPNLNPDGSALQLAHADLENVLGDVGSARDCGIFNMSGEADDVELGSMISREPAHAQGLSFGAGGAAIQSSHAVTGLGDMERVVGAGGRCSWPRRNFQYEF